MYSPESHIEIEEGDSILKDLTKLPITPYPVNSRSKNLKSLKNNSLSGRAFLNRFDLLMNLNEQTKSIPEVSFMNLLDANYLTNYLHSNNFTRTKNFFRGMIDDSVSLLDDSGWNLHFQPYYKQSSGEFQLFFELQVHNNRSEKLFIMAPRLFSDEGIEFMNPEELSANLEIPPKEQINLSLCLQISQMDLPLVHPPLFVFFAFGKSEFDNLLEKGETNLRMYKKMVALPINICKFMIFPSMADFEVLDTLTLTEEMMISNKKITLIDLKKIFPNLSEFFVL